MWSTSSHARDERAADLAQWAVLELDGVEQLVVAHKELRARGVPVLVFSYAQMLWRPQQVHADVACT